MIENNALVMKNAPSVARAIGPVRCWNNSATGAISGDQVRFALALLPLMGTGLWCSRYLHRHVDGGWLRPAMLVLSTVAGTAAIVHGLA
jgi:hypothetical protein